MTTTAQLHIKVIITAERPNVITFCPNPKTEGVSLFFVGTSAVVDVPETARRNPIDRLVVTVDAEKKRNELIVLETRLGGESFLHLLEVSWKARGPYVDLAKAWVPGSEQSVIQPIKENSGYVLRVQVSRDIYATGRCASDADDVIVTTPDLLCQLAVGVISPRVFKKRTQASVGAEVSQEGPSVDYTAECARLQQENSKLEETLVAARDEIEQRDRRLGVYQVQVDEINGSLIRIQAELRQARGEAADFSNQLAEAKARFVTFEQQVGDLTKSLQQKTTAYEDACREKGKLVQELAKANSKLESANIRIGELLRHKQAVEEAGLPEVRSLMVTIHNANVELSRLWLPFRSRFRRARAIIRDETREPWFQQRLKYVTGQQR